MNVVLNRIKQTDDFTLGLLAFDGQIECTTLEPPWKDNKRNESCIPAGEYMCKAVEKRLTTGGLYIEKTFEIQVFGRSGVLFHIGNLAEDTSGCILIGTGFHGPMITQSRVAFLNKFLPRLMDNTSFKLTIKEPRLEWE